MLLAVFAIIFIGRLYFARQANVDHQSKKGYARRNKYPEVDVFGMRSMFLGIGLVFTLMLTIGAFNWTIEEKKIFIPDDALALDEEIEIEVPRSAEPPPPPPPPPPPVIEEVPNEVVLEADEEVEFVDQTVDVETAIDAPVFTASNDDVPPPPPPPPPPPEPQVREIFKVVEEMPRFPGCEDLATIDEKKVCAEKKLLEYIYANIKYPSIARENGIQGTVVLQFVVDTDGTVSDAKVLRDIGAKCGEEGLRIVEAMNEMDERWTPGKQRGKAVPVMFTMPIRFVLEYQ